MSAARDLAKLGNTNTLKVDTIRSKVGINSTVPTGDLQVGAAITVGSASGIISATAFYGDGSNLEGVSSAGLGTALSETDGDAAQLIYYTNNTLGIGSTVNIKVPTGSDVAYTQYADIDVQENCDFIVSDGDDFIPDVLGLSTAGVDVITGAGGRIRAGYFTNKAGTGAPQLTFGAEVPVGYGITGAGGINVSGFATAGGFVGNLTGDVTGDTSGSSGSCSGNAATATLATNAQGLSGTPDITVNNITGVAATFTGVLTYEDVTNVDSTGIVTARGGFKAGAPTGTGVTIGVDNSGDAIFAGIVTAGTCFKAGSVSGGAFGAGVGVTITGDGNADFVGIVTITTGTDLSGYKVESGYVDAATSLNGGFDCDLANGHIQRFSAATGGNYFPDFRIGGGVSLDSVLDVGDVVSVTLIVASSSHYCTTGIEIDNSTSNLDIDWVGGSAPSASNGSGFDVYAFTIQKTAATPAYHIIGNALGVA